MNSILSPAFRYTNSASTNIAKTFARIRREQKLTEPKRIIVVREAQPTNVRRILVAK